MDTIGAKARLTAAWIAVLLTQPVLAGTETRAAAKASVVFRVVVPAMVRAVVLDQPSRLEVGEQDIARGYVDLDEATTLSLTSNARGGFGVSARFDTTFVDRVVVRIRGQALAFEGGARSLLVAASRMMDVPMKVGYRLYLRPAAAAGGYRWPVALTFGVAN